MTPVYSEVLIQSISRKLITRYPDYRLDYEEYIRVYFSRVAQKLLNSENKKSNVFEGDVVDINHINISDIGAEQFESLKLTAEEHWAEAPNSEFGNILDSAGNLLKSEICRYFDLVIGASGVDYVEFFIAPSPNGLSGRILFLFNNQLPVPHYYLGFSMSKCSGVGCESSVPWFSIVPGIVDLSYEFSVLLLRSPRSGSFILEDHISLQEKTRFRALSYFKEIHKYLGSILA